MISTKRRLWIACGLAIALRALSCIPAIIDEDEAWFAASAAALRTPFAFFQSAIDNKPPGTAWFYWLVGTLTGAYPNPRLVRAAALLGLVLTAALMARLVRSLGGKRREGELGIVTALLTLVATALFSPKLSAVTNESLMLPLIVGAYVFILAPPRFLNELVQGFLSGVLIALATLIKQTGAVFLLPLLFATPLAGTLGGRVILRRMGGFVFGFGLVLIAAVVALGPGDFWYWTYRYPREVLIGARGQLFSWRDGFWNIALFCVALWPLVTTIMARKFRSSEKVSGEQGPFLAAWFSCAAIAVAAGRGLFPHYFILAVPPLVIASVLRGREKLFTPLRTIWLAGVFTVVSLIAAHPGAGLFWGTDNGYHAELSSRIKAWTKPDDRIWIWGGSVIPLALGQRLHATSFLCARFVMPPYATEAIRTRFEDEFDRNPPELILDLHQRGDNQFNYSLARYPAFAERIARDYVYRRDPSLPWAGFYFRKPHVLPNTISEAPDSDEHALWLETQSLFSSPQQLAKTTGLSQLRRMDHLMRARMALAFAPSSIRNTLAGELDGEWNNALQIPVDRDFAPYEKKVLDLFSSNGWDVPFALQSMGWWVSLSIVKLQPVADREGGDVGFVPISNEKH